MSFMYPRVIAITRPPDLPGVGFQSGYAGTTPAQEAPVAADLPASIQLRREGQKAPVGLPADGNGPYWDVFIPKASASPGLILQRDIVTDDTGERFQVVANYWDSLGYRLRCMKLDA